MFSFIHAADIHLDSPLRSLERYEGAPVEELRRAPRQALANLTDLALEQRVDFVLLAGDLFDGDWKDYNTGLFLTRQLARLQQAEIPVLIAAGNHDAANRMSKDLNLPETVHRFSVNAPESLSLPGLDVVVHGQSFATASVSADLASGFPQAVPGKYNIGLLHTSLAGHAAGHAVYAPCTLQGLRDKGYDYWALGHVHQHAVVSEDPFVVYPGAIQGRHSRETGPKGCCLVQVDDAGRANLEFHTLDVLRWHRLSVDITGAETAPEALKAFSSALEQTLAESSGMPLALRVEFTGPCPAHARLNAELERWTAEVRNLAVEIGLDQVWVEKVLFSTSGPSNETQPAQGPLRELDLILKQALEDPGLMKDLAGPILDLRDKLPPGVEDEDAVLDPESDEGRARLVEQARALLMTRLGRSALDHLSDEAEA